MKINDVKMKINDIKMKKFGEKTMQKMFNIRGRN